MELAQLGWDEYFQKQVDELGVPDIVIGRIFRVDAGGHYGILTTEGDLRARITGRMREGAGSAADLPGIGDWVLLKKTETGNVIFKFLERKKTILARIKNGTAGIPGASPKRKIIPAAIVKALG